MSEQIPEDLVAKLVRLRLGQLDPNVVASCIDGDSSKRARDDVERLLASDPDALVQVRGYSRHARLAARWLGPAAVAAAVLVFILITLASSTLDREPSSLDTDRRMAQIARELRTETPSLFGDFTLLTAVEIERVPGTNRGGARWVAPAGLLLRAPAALRWTPPDGSTHVEVRILGSGVHWRETSNDGHMPAPELSPGAYTVELRALDGMSRQVVRSGFEIADADTRVDHELAFERIEDKASGDLGRLVRAHYAIRAGLFEEARLALRAIDAEGPLAQRAKALLRHIDGD